MADKKVLIGGFAIGAAIGTAILPISDASRPVAASEPATENVDAPAVSERERTYSAPYAARERQRTPTFEDMVDFVARGQGGKISISQMAALADIYGRLHGTPSTDYDRPIGGRRMGTGSSADADHGMPGTDVPYRNSRSVPYLELPTIGGDSLGGTSSSRRYSQALPSVDDRLASASPNVGAINVRTGEYMAPAGPGAYVNTRDGTFYAPAGPNGVVDTRTGEFIPVTR